MAGGFHVSLVSCVVILPFAPDIGECVSHDSSRQSWESDAARRVEYVSRLVVASDDGKVERGKKGGRSNGASNRGIGGSPGAVRYIKDHASILPMILKDIGLVSSSAWKD